jgi:hypothetical protein
VVLIALAMALVAFKRSYFSYDDPALLYNIAQCHRALQHNAIAVAFYRFYLRKAPDAQNRDEVERIISELESTMARSLR